MSKRTNNSIEKDSRTQPDPFDSERFIGINSLIDKQAEQLEEFEVWFQNRDWLAFHHHHYDWWMFPIDEISSRGKTFQLTYDAFDELRQNQNFIERLRRGVFLLCYSWAWDIERREFFEKTQGKQGWAHWPVRLYKAGRCMYLFGQYDYYASLKDLAKLIKFDKNSNIKERLDFFSHTKNAKVDVLEQWAEMERTM